MPSGLPPSASRDLHIDWLRGLAMTCVIVNHSRVSSLLSWFSYERFWIVTAAEVFVVLSGIVLGMVYGHRLARDGWVAVARRLVRRALLLYVTFIGVTLSILAISFAGVDVHSLTSEPDRASVWLLNPGSMDAAAWRDIVLMRLGPRAFEIVGLYVWLVAAAVPCLMALRFLGWRPLLAVSWGLYFSYRLAPYQLTAAEFESVFPILAWQLLFVHGITIGYHRDWINSFVAQRAKIFRIATAAASIAFGILAFCNPWAEGPSWLRFSIISPEHFTYLYDHYFTLNTLGIGRIVNLAVALPVGYAMLSSCWTLARRLQIVFVTLGQQSLGAFVLHVYGVLLVAHVTNGKDLWINTLTQIMLIVAIAALLNGVQQLRPKPQRRSVTRPQLMAAAGKLHGVASAQNVAQEQAA